MSEDKRAKRYYWLKLKEDFFDDDTISWIEEQENGKEYCLFYLKLCLKSLKNDGMLFRNVGDMIIPYDVAKISEITRTEPDTVMVALNLFEKIGIVNRMDNGTFFVTQINEMVGSETDYARSKRIERAKKNNWSEIGQTKSKKSKDCGSTKSGAKPTFTNSGQCPKNVTQSIEYRVKSKDIKSKDKTVVKNPKPKSKSEKRTYDDQSPYYQLASYLLEFIKKNNPKYSKKPNMQSWSDDMRKLVEIDGYSLHDVSKVIKWCQTDSFWQFNILSPAKLRKQFDQLYPKANAGKGKPFKTDTQDYSTARKKLSKDKFAF